MNAKWGEDLTMSAEQEQALKDARALLQKHFTEVFVIASGVNSHGKVINSNAYFGDVGKLLPLLDNAADIFSHHVYERS
jgi:hypothetical protein